MSATPAPIFVDTGAFYAVYDEDDAHHEEATAVVDALASGALPYGPVFTSRYVLSELATLLLYRVGQSAATTALDAIRESGTFNLLDVGPDRFDRAAGQFSGYDDQEISFVDHLSAVLAADAGVDHVFAFDDDFRTLGFTVVPGDVGL